MIGLTMIPVSRPLAAPNTKRYLLECATSGWFSSQGSFVAKFEKAFASYLGVKFAVAVPSGTAALHVALAALNLTKNDEVIVPTFTMFSSVAAILYTGATPVFVDSDPHTWTPNISHIANKITKRTKAIIAVHIYGHPADMGPLRKLAKTHNLALVEDAAEGLGAYYNEKKVGTLSDVACFSLYANKVVTTGEGGMVVTNNARLSKRLKSLTDMAYDSRKRFLHTELGFTYRMSNMQAAVGLASLEQIDKTISRKRDIAGLYDKMLTKIPFIVTQKTAPWATPVWWMYGIVLAASSPISRDQLRKKLLLRNIDTRDFFVPAHVQPALKKQNIHITKKYPVASMLSRQGLYLPSGPAIKDRDIRFVCKAIQQIYESL